MEKNTHSTGETPPDCFRLEELDAFQTVENQVLVDVNYYLWLNQAEADEAPYRFLYYLELVFDEQPPLLLTSGDDSEAIRVSDAGALLKTADALRRLHGKVIIQRVNAGNLPLWQPLIGQTLNAVRLSPTNNCCIATMPCCSISAPGRCSCNSATGKVCWQQTGNNPYGFTGSRYISSLYNKVSVTASISILTSMARIQLSLRSAKSQVPSSGEERRCASTLTPDWNMNAS